MYRAKLQEQLRARSTENADSGCWEWQGQISNSGHGRLKIYDEVTDSNRIVSAEDASYIVFLGGIPDGSLVRQRCNNRLCVNPEHLELFKV